MNLPRTRSSFLLGGAALTASQTLVPLHSLSAQMVPVLKIGTVPIEAQAEAIYAEDQGFFKKNGIAATEITIMRNGATIAGAVAGNELVMGCANLISLGQALGRGLPFTAITPASVYDSNNPNGFIVVAPNSAIKTAKDLNGQTVAGATLGGLDQLSFQAFMARNGGDYTTVKFTEIPQSATAEAVLNGRVVAAILNDPEYSAAKDRLRVLGDGQGAIARYYTQTAWFTTRDWLANNKDTAHRFNDAILAAGGWAMANPEAAAAVLNKRFNFRETRARQRYATSRDPASMQLLLDAAAKYKIIPQLSVADFFWNGK